MSPFPDRLQAGQLLALQLEEMTGRNNVVVLALPRGGVPIGYAIAARLETPLDVFLVGKIGVPGHEDMTLGAVSSSGICVLRPETIALMDIPPEVIEAAAHRELRQMQRRARVYRSLRPQIELQGRIAILADDGLVTGATMTAAVRALRHEHPAKIIVAVPVGAAEIIAELRMEADAVVCLEVPEWLASVGQWYADATPVTDALVVDFLQKAAQWRIPDDASDEMLVVPAAPESGVPARGSP